MNQNTERFSNFKTKKKDSLKNPVQKTIDFDKYISQKYNELIKNLELEKTQLLEKTHLLLYEQKEIDSNQSRGLIRRKLQIQCELDLINKQIQKIDSGEPLEEFKTKIIPFTEAYERELQINSLEKIRKHALKNSQLPRDEEKTHTQKTNNITNNITTNNITNNTTTNNITNNTTTNNTKQSSEVLKDVIQELENKQPEIIPMINEICEECDDVMILESRSSMLVCSCCGNWREYIDATSSHMAYGEEVEFTAFAYLRLNHFNERLTYSQAKESTRITDEDLQKVMDRLIEKRITDPNKITMEITYNVAKELKMRHIYKQNTQLWCRITGKSPPRLLPIHEEWLRDMFRAVNQLWNKYKPDERKNFLSYNYCLYKFCELLNFPDEIKNLYKLLKGDKKLEKQDEIFKKVCEDPKLQWEFIPSKKEF